MKHIYRCFLLLFALNTLKAQDVSTYSLKFFPLSMVDPSDPNIQLGLERRLGPKTAIELDAGVNYLQKDLFFKIPMNSFKLKSEFVYHKNHGAEYALQFKYVYKRTFKIDDFYTPEHGYAFRFSHGNIEQHILIFNPLFMSFTLRNDLTIPLEVYLGLGLGFSHSVIYNYTATSYYSDDQIEGWPFPMFTGGLILRPNIDIGIKIGCGL